MRAREGEMRKQRYRGQEKLVRLFNRGGLLHCLRVIDAPACNYSITFVIYRVSDFEHSSVDRDAFNNLL